MNKKSIIILIVSILILLLALAIFVYANFFLKKNSTNNNPQIIQSTVDSTIAKGPFFYDIDGKKYNFDDFADKPLVVFLWKSDDLKSYTIINLITKYYEEYKDTINFLSINVNEPDIDLELIDNVKAANFKIPMYFDTDLTISDKYPYNKLPELLFISQEDGTENTVVEEISEDAFLANLDLLIKNY